MTYILNLINSLVKFVVGIVKRMKQLDTNQYYDKKYVNTEHNKKGWFTGFKQIANKSNITRGAVIEGWVYEYQWNGEGNENDFVCEEIQCGF